MTWPRFRFSIRTLLIAVTVLAAVLGLWLRFSPHVIFTLFPNPELARVPPGSYRPLVATPPGEQRVRFQAGPLSFELPESLARSVTTIDTGGGRYFRFQADGRTVHVRVPWPQQDHKWLAVRFPDRVRTTPPRILQQITAVRVSDFSWSMSAGELRWHEWLLSKRNRDGQPPDMEFLWRTDLEGVLLSPRERQSKFEWATVDCQWSGDIFFVNMSADDHNWIRHLCATFTVNGDPNIFTRRNEEELKAMIRISEVQRQP